MQTLKRAAVLGALTVVLVAIPAFVAAQPSPVPEEDPAANVALPCNNLLPTGPSLTPQGRSNHNIVHLWNGCGLDPPIGGANADGFVGTDIEFQSRYANGKTFDYAFVGTMGEGFKIFDITPIGNGQPPQMAGRYVDSGWQNDIQVRGNIAVSTFDGVAGEPTTASLCLQTTPGSGGQGVDIFKLTWHPQNATTPIVPAAPAFTVNRLGCVANPPGGAHNSTIHPSGQWLAISNCCSDWAVDVVDLRPLSATPPGPAVHRYRLIDASRRDTAGKCPTGATYYCIVMRRPAAPALGSSEANVPDRAGVTCPTRFDNAQIPCGLWRPHDVHFSGNGSTMYVAALNSTFIVNVANMLTGTPKATTLSIIPNISEPPPPASSDPLDNPRNLQLSHQADVSSDGKIVVMSDERGGGIGETRCNTEPPPADVVGGLHFWAIAPDARIPQSAGASHASPKKLGTWFNPNPGLFPDVLQTVIDSLPISTTRPATPRFERGCTAHVFRLGGNGTASPGPIQPGFHGVSNLASRLLTMGSYGAGVWMMAFWAPTNHAKEIIPGVSEAPQSTWGNTRGWNVQPGADAWSAKEYRGFIYAGDMLRGFDVYGCGTGAPCARDPVVALRKAGPTAAQAGAFVTYTITYTNAGPAPAENAQIVDILPTNLYFNSASNGGTFDSATRRVTWKLGTVPVGATGSVTIKLRIAPATAPRTVVINRADFHADLTVSNTAYATTTVQP